MMISQYVEVKRGLQKSEIGEGRERGRNGASEIIVVKIQGH